MSEEIHVVGGGPAGLAAAILLAETGLPVIAHAPPPPATDTRTSALMRSSIRLLDAIGVWRDLKPRSAALAHMRLVDVTGRLLRAPDVTFDATELGEKAFGYNIRNRDLVAALLACSENMENLMLDPRPIARIEPRVDAARLETGDGETFDAILLAAADGRRSRARTAAGIETTETRHDQVALAFDLSHERAHGNVSTEFHTEAGPMTFVPLPGNESSVVWVVRPDEAEELTALSETAFAERVHERSFGFLGKIGRIGPRASFPLSTLTAERMGARRIALVGEAGHVVPPIGAQGLNLGLRDAASLAEIVAGCVERGVDPGSAEALDDYDNWRRADIASRVAGVDMLNRSVLSAFLPAQMARGAGLYLLGQVGPLRRMAMEAGLDPPGRLPRIMEAGAG